MIARDGRAKRRVMGWESTANSAVSISSFLDPFPFSSSWEGRYHADKRDICELGCVKRCGVHKWCPEVMRSKAVKLPLMLFFFDLIFTVLSIIMD